jgi:hypothetical protein
MENQVQIYKPIKQNELIQSIVNVPEVVSNLTKIENQILKISANVPINSMSQNEACNAILTLIQYISIDVGFKSNKESSEWTYTKARLYDFIIKYYSYLSTSDIKLAFELSVLGELNDYLPKDSKGNADNNHYQQFNVDYFSKILNAFKSKQNAVIFKAKNLLPVAEVKISEEEKNHRSNLLKYDLIISFLKYKYLHVYEENSSISILMFYNLLLKAGIAEEIDLNENKILHGYEKELNDKYKLNNFIKPKEDVSVSSITRKQKKQIINAFDYLIEKELQITNYIKYRK